MKKISFFPVLFASLLAFTQNNIVLNADKGKDIINKNIYGHFAEHLGHCIYDGFYVGDSNKTIPHKDGVRLDVIEALKKLKELPVIISNRKESWRYLGFKHVNGPAKWSSYAKAAYIAEVHRKYKVPLADIANQIGDRHNTVQRLNRSSRS